MYSTHHVIRHYRRNCHDWINRNAVFVTKSNAEVYALNGTTQSINSNGVHSRVFNFLCQSLTRVQVGPKNAKVEPVDEKEHAVEATSQPGPPNGMHLNVWTFPYCALIRYDTVPINRKLKPISGKINAVDEAGTRWAIQWSRVEIEVVEAVTSTVCKITGTAIA